MTSSAIAEAFKYAGLYAYDFGTHISYGYTAAEIRILRNAPAYRDGRALEIYRVNVAGGFELRGVREERIGLREAFAFLRRDAAAARRDYDAIVAAAEKHPLPCPVEVQVARLYGFDPSNATTLEYPAGAGTAVGSWLMSHGLNLGDRVLVGADVRASIASSDGLRISRAELPTRMRHVDRSAAEVLGTVDHARQR